MGEMSEYFEDFPEENPGNYVDDRFDPQGAALQRERKAKVAAKIAQETTTLEQTIARMIAEGKARGEERKRAENSAENQKGKTGSE